MCNTREFVVPPEERELLVTGGVKLLDRSSRLMGVAKNYQKAEELRINRAQELGLSPDALRMVSTSANTEYI